MSEYTLGLDILPRIPLILIVLWRKETKFHIRIEHVILQLPAF